MSPARARRERQNRLTLIGMFAEIAYVLGLSTFWCFICSIAYFAARWIS